MNDTYPFKMMPLPFGVNQLSPYIDGRTVRVHYGRLYRKYVETLNELVSETPELKNKTLEEILSEPEKIPEKKRTKIMRNAGGVYNHQIYFSCLGRRGDTLPPPKLRFALNASFGSFEDFVQKFSEAALSVFGSGYAWLVSGEKGNLMIVTTANQETPLEHGLKPIFCCDVWEHAYFLQYLNQRADYVKSFFNVINWRAAEANLIKAK